MLDIMEGLKVEIRTHETWLHFSSSKGKHCSFCIENKFPPICAKVMTEWIQDRLKNQQHKDTKATDKLIREGRIDRE